MLAALLVHAGESVSTDRLIDFVWGQDPPPTARKSVQTYVSRLRRTPGEGLIEASTTGYALNVDGGKLDADRFEELVEKGRGLAGTDAEAAWETLGAALRLWRGSPLSDIEAHGDLVPYVERLGEARLAAIEDRVEAGLALGRHGELVGELRALVEAHPLRERLWEQLMLALYRSGRHAEALRAYQQCRRILGEELGIEPSATLQRLEERILSQDPGLDLEMSTPITAETLAPVRNPYKGLRPFSEADAEDFFGREALVDELASRIEAGVRFLALVGPSGSGKSSVALAGLIPAVRRLTPGVTPLVAGMTPGTHPFAQLEAALTRAAPDHSGLLVLPPADRLSLLRAVLTIVPNEQTEVLLVIDQLEELLTGAIAEETVRAFMRNLIEAVEDPHGQLSVVVTLRADFFERALRQPELAELLAAGVINVPPLSPIELQAAIVRPAQAVGLDVEPELLAELVAETADRPGSLPLLQFVLTELTDRAPGRVLTLAALRQAGGIRGTLAHQSERLYESLSGMGRKAARLVFLRLVALGEGGQATRRVVFSDDLQLPAVSEHARREALDALVRGRLLTVGRGQLSGRSTVEVSHEAVFHEWPRCARWIDEARSDIRQAGDLERAAADWAAADNSSDYLLTGSRLRVYEDWIQRTELGTSPMASAFLEASLERRRREERVEADRSERELVLQRRAVNRLRVGVGILALLVLVTTGLSLFAADRSREATRERTAALAAATEILVRQLSFAAVAEAGRDPELSLLLALHAVELASLRGDPIPAETIEALHWGLQEIKVQYPVTDGDVLVLVGTEGRRGAYHLPTEELVRLARSNVNRQLTADECRAFLSSAGECPVLAADLGQIPLAAEEIPVGGPELLEGTTVRAFTGHGDDEANALRAEFEAFTQQTGIEVSYISTTETETMLTLGGVLGRADIVAVPWPGDVASEAAAGRLMDLGRYLSFQEVASDYGPYLTSWGTVGSDGGFPAETGTLHSVPMGASVKSLIWYIPEQFAKAGYEIPTTWEALVDLSDRIVADGGTPWCFGMASGGFADGWPATDWVEDLLLHEYGPEVYDSWVNREIPFSDPRVRRAFERLGDVFFTDGYAYGGTNEALGTPYWAGFFPLFDDPPGCWLHHQASFLSTFFPPGIEVGEDVSAFLTPSISEEHRDAVLGGGDFLLVYGDRPEVRTLVRHMASPDWGSQMVEIAPGFLLPNRSFDSGLYPEEWRRVVAATLSRAQAEDELRFDGSDLMPQWIGGPPFWEAMLDYLQGGPERLDSILARLDALEDPEAP